MKVFIYMFLLSFFVFAQKNSEFRSTWVITWEHINRNNSVSQNKANVRHILDQHKKANMNAVLWQVRQSGTAYYNSSYEPWGYYAGSQYPGYDPLQYAIEEAHKRGMELHAWFNVFNVSSTEPGTIAAEHPNWICTNVDGQFMTSYRSASPGLEAVREYTINVAMEIVRNYDIDGLHLDYVRWNEYDEDDMNPDIPSIKQISILDGEEIQSKINKGNNALGTKRFIYDIEHPASSGIPNGFNSWEDWRRWSVTEFVRVLHDSIQAVKPWVKLSPAALGKYRAGGNDGWNGYYRVWQDAALWFNSGYIDQLTPMHYHWTNGNDFINTLNSDWKPYISSGIASGRLYSVGPASYILKDNQLMYRHKDIVEACRTIEWVDGFQFFSYGSWEDEEYWDDGKRNFFQTKTKISAVIQAEIPESPSVTIHKTDSLNYDLVISPSLNTIENSWYALYRSEAENINPEDDQILFIGFGQDTMYYSDNFSDAGFFNGRFKYYATTLNRYWNESANSNIVETDSLSLSAPAPLTPNVSGVFSLSDSELLLSCVTTENADIYRALISTDGVNYSDSIDSSVPEILIEELTPNETYFFKVKALNQRGESELNRYVFGGIPSSIMNKRILVVDGFDRSTNTRFDYVKSYAEPIKQSGYSFSYILNEYLISNASIIFDYDIVFWFVGDESAIDETFSSAEQEVVKQFLQGGGKFFVSGSEIGWDLEGKTGHPTSSDVYFYNNYLKAKYVEDSPGNIANATYSAEGIDNFNNLINITFDNGTHGTFNVDWPDVIKGVNGGINIMQYTNCPSTTGYAGVSFSGMFPNGINAGKVVYLGFPLDAVYPEVKRIEIIQAVLEYFELQVGVEDVKLLISNEFKIFGNYPNPFNPSTKIKFNLPESDEIKISLYNLLGEKVDLIFEGSLNRGVNEIEFNSNKDLSSGIYIYSIQSLKGFNGINKMILLK